MTIEPDVAIVDACLKGDREAFGTLIDRYERKMFNVAFRVVGDHEDAMDATQQAFVKAYEKLGTFNRSYRFFSWIYRIVLNESLNIVTRRKRFAELDEDTTVSTKTPEENYGETELGRHIQGALQVLKPDYRTVVILKHLQELSYQEISEILDLPEKTVKSRLFTARRQLKEILSKRGVR